MEIRKSQVLSFLAVILLTLISFSCSEEDDLIEPTLIEESSENRSRPLINRPYTH